MSKAKHIVGLDGDADAVRGMRLVLRARLDELCQLGRTALDWAGPEDVHNFRIALHRLQSEMRDFKPYLKMERLIAAYRQLKALSRALSAVRNQDVIVTALERLRQESSFELSAGIEVLINEAYETRDRMFDALMRAAKDAALINLQKEFTGGLVEMAGPAKKGSESPLPLSLSQAAHQIILVRLKKLQELGTCLYQPFKIMRIYRTRIAAKRLRYALDLFGACWQEGQVEPFLEEVAHLQKSLGKLHDCDLLIRKLSQWFSTRERSGESLNADNEKERAVVWILGHLVKSRAKHYCEALELWHGWEVGGFVPRLKATLGRRADTEWQSLPAAGQSLAGLPGDTAEKSVALNNILDSR